MRTWRQAGPLTMVMAALAVVAAAVAQSAESAAQSYPQKPVRMVVPFPPGGVADIAGRVVGQKLSERWGQQVIIDNRTGAGGILGAEVAARAAPDGYTLLMTTGDFATIFPAAYAKLPYDPDKDFQPVAIVTNTPLVFIRNPDTPFKDVHGLIAAAKAKPGEIAFSSPGAGSTNHLTGELFASAAGLKLLHVPYRGGAPAAAAVASAEVPFGVIAISSAMPFVTGGKMAVLGVTSAQRVELVSDWPTLAEGGVPGFNAALWVGAWVPAGVPAPIVQKLHDDIAAAVKEKDVRERFASLGAGPVEMTSAEFKAYIKRETDRFTAVVKQAGVHIE